MLPPRDTSAAAWAVQLDCLGKLTPGRRVELMSEMSDDSRELLRCGIRQRHPDYTSDEVEHAMLRIWLGDDLYSKAYRRPLLDA
ncbi:MAG: hypothetical protein IT370_29680 [Deltaproteobacteria bacterium]|nr:hypothetical protein [Deltaproteobacteria bacterium]